MKRTALTRKTPMPRATTMPRTTAQPRTEARARAPHSARPKPRTTGPSAETRMTVEARDHGLCVRCGQPASDKHHRKGRGMGGTKGAESDRINGPGWLLTVCGHGNGSGCHQWVDDNRAHAVATGYVIPRNGPYRDAEDTPVLTLHGWALFDNDGGITPCPPPAGWEAF